MQVSQGSTRRTFGISVTALLWLGLAGVGAAMLVRPSGLALAIGLLTLFVAAVVATFSLRYMRADARPRRFYALLAGLVASVLGFLFTGHLAVLALAWCASGWLLATLIGHAERWAEADAAARRARLAFLAGDAGLLVALAILARHAGSLEIGPVLASVATLPAALATVAALLLVTAAAARCALPPFSGWLLSSMTAPTPVSALMHAGLVNAGGFLLLRFAPVLEAAPLARAVAVAAGLCGALYGIGIMMVRPDVKRSLAGSTVSQMGFMIMSCGLGAYSAALWHLVAHGLFKAWLFLGSGSAIGLRAGRPVAPLSGGACAGIALATAGTGLGIVAAGQGGAGLVPLVLGLATALATAVAALGGKAPLRAKAPLVVAVGALVAFHGAGLAASRLAAGPDAAALVPDWALLALLAVFLAGWTWQQHRFATARSLPLRLYVHLINAGTLAAARKGDAQ